ncbi:hypothetical protein CLF_111057 [Clonorchis sinensis]|uniref:Uncharacterized protein n=1 Tax=Clonorchis sinensis TaxID=79923 RepID=G7YU96_CLOSI|nr:hypothetical protein CLF_111057 [Clonorchis sinensis]
MCQLRKTECLLGVSELSKPLPANSAALVTAVFLDGDPETGHINARVSNAQLPTPPPQIIGERNCGSYNHCATSTRFLTADDDDDIRCQDFRVGENFSVTIGKFESEGQVEPYGRRNQLTKSPLVRISLIDHKGTKGLSSATYRFVCEGILNLKPSDVSPTLIHFSRSARWHNYGLWTKKSTPAAKNLIRTVKIKTRKTVQPIRSKRLAAAETGRFFTMIMGRQLSVEQPEYNGNLDAP